MSHEIRFVFQITPLKNSFCHSLSNSKQVFLQEKKTICNSSDVSENIFRCSFSGKMSFITKAYLSNEEMDSVKKKREN